MTFDFAGTDLWLRSIAFAGIVGGAAVLCWWVLNLPAAATMRLAAAAVAALATIPAAIVAPLADGTPLRALGALSISAFCACAAVAFVPVLRDARAPGIGPAEPSPAAGPEPGSKSRVATYAAVTEARAARVGEETVALGQAALPLELAFLVEYSGGGHPRRLAADSRIGREPSAEFPLDDAAASREHARIKLEEGRFVLYDLGSTNGTRLVRQGRRRRVGAPVPLADLDMIEIGQARLVFLRVEEPRP